MTDREVIAELKRQVELQGYTLAEYDSISAASSDDKSEYKIIWDNKSVCFIEISHVHVEVPSVIKELKEIGVLSIERSSFDLAWIGRLKTLNRLMIFNCDYQNIPDDFSMRKDTENLFLSSSGLSHLPAVVKEMTGLTKISISNSYAHLIKNDPIQKWFQLPDWLSQLPKLKKLELTNAFIHSIPLDLVNTKMPFVTENDYEKDGIKLFGTSLLEGNISLFSQPRHVIEAFYLGQQSVVRECKVIFLGEGKSGKTSLIERMINDAFEEGTLPTEGIRMQTWPVTIDKETVRLRILDFGGQEIMHAMHRCFMTQHTDYVLVCEVRQDGDIDREAARWLENLHSFARGCPVILALNKADENPNASVNETNLRAVNPALQRPVETSAKWEQARGTAPLLAAIKKAVWQTVGQMEGNAGILGLKQALENMEEDYITDDKYRALCIGHGVHEEDIQSNLLDWFKDLGVCYYYTSASLNTRLEGLRVLNPGWLTNGIYRLILRTPPNGILSHTLIKKTLKATDPHDILPQKEYHPQETEFILQVMRTFEISHDMGDGNELIPMKMPKEPPDAAEKWDKTTALHLSWRASYLPNTVAHRLMIRKYDEMDKKCIWRSGACFESRDKQHRALVNMSDTRIDVYVQGSDKRVYMEAFRKEIINILLDLNLQPEEMVHFYWEGMEREAPYIEVLELYHRGRSEVYVKGAKDYPNPAKILQEHYVEEKGRAVLKIENSEINVVTGSGQITTGNATGINLHDVDNKGGIHANRTHVVGAEDPQQILESIQRRNMVEQNDFDALLAQLKELSAQKGLSFGMRRKLKGVLKECEGRTSTSAWGKLQSFLGNAANLTTLIAFAVTYAPAFVEALQKIF